MKKKILALVLVLALVASLAVALVACNPDGPTNTLTFGPEDSDIKFGLICLHDENSTYDKNFIDAARSVAESLQVRVIVKTNIDEDAECYDMAADLVDQGCNIIFADSFGHEDYIIQAAKEFPNVMFGHATGTKAHTEQLPNYFNGFASIYQARYLAGIVTGYELKKMQDEGRQGTPTLGYVGAYTYAEVISGYTSFYLGAKSVCPDVQMKVQFTGSWYDPTLEGEAATALINSGCWVISQHADSMGAPNVCKSNNVPNVTYNISTKAECGDSYLVGSKINWAPYYSYLIENARNNTKPAYDWTGTISTDSVVVLEFGNTVTDEVKQAVETAKAELAAGTREVFDVNNFTVTVDKANGKNVNAIVEGMAEGATTGQGHLVSYMADVDTDANYTADHQVVQTKTVNDVTITYFAESIADTLRSAPYFDLQIDGITLLNQKF